VYASECDCKLQDDLVKDVSMRRRPMSLRLSEEEAAALKRAADADKRTAGALARIILVTWLTEQGYLQAEPH
jgi:hypothetical protein